MICVRHLPLLVALALFLLAGVLSAVAEAGPAIDTRVAIDVSGSMKRTDPGNLRAPALRLLTGLLPSGSSAGVWTFGRYVNMEIAHGPVDDAWRGLAERGAARIHSRGLFTNIEDAMRRATRSWRGRDPQTLRTLVLLTDGMVDVSKRQADNDASRRRILEQLLPDLVARDIKVMTVALSDEADHVLLRTLAQETGGWYESAGSAADLQRAFLRVFEQAAQPDTVPLDNNTFQADASIEELTLLVFRAAGSSPTVLHAPDGGVYVADAVPAGVSWRSDEGYDLVTIERPQPGQWRVEADLDPDNRVMLVTDLRLEAEPPPAQLTPGDGRVLEAWLSESGERIERDGFTRLVRMLAEHVRPGGEVSVYPLERDPQHVFSTLVQGLAEEGEHVISLAANSATFARERVFRFAVAMPVAVEVGDIEQGLPVTVRARPEFVVPASVVLEARLRDAAGQEHPVRLLASGLDVWQGSLGELSGAHELLLRVSGRSPSGTPLDYAAPPIAVLSPAPVEPQPPPEPAAEPAGFDWLTFAWQLGAVNALVLFAAGLIWWLRRRRADTGLRLAGVKT